jgi:hypothetical protein
MDPRLFDRSEVCASLLRRSLRRIIYANHGSDLFVARVEWILSAADPQTLGEESPQNAIKFSGRQGFRQLALYFRDSLNAISGDLTGCISHHHLVFAFGRVRLRSPAAVQLAETNIAAKITFS